MSSESLTRTLRVLRPGIIEYDAAVNLQRELVERMKRGERERNDWLILLRHPPVFTIGRSGDAKHILADAERLLREGIQVRYAGRGGDVTYHGPGQIVGYPILSLAAHGKDVHKYMRRLESVIIATLAEFGIAAGRRPGFTGVWAGEEKIAAIGIAIRSWISYHGFALNVDPNMEHFRLIYPCGIRDRGVTSMRLVLQRPVDEGEVERRLIEQFAAEFGFERVVETEENPMASAEARAGETP